MKFIRFAWFLTLLFAASTCFAQNPIPSISQPLVPGTVAPGRHGFSLTVHGAGFVSASIVNWNGNPLRTRFVSASKLRAEVPAEDVYTNGTARVTVVNPRPGGGSSDAVFFTITEPASSLAFRTLPVEGMGITSPINVLTADFNNDGIADLAVIDQAPAPSCNYQYHGVGSVAILLGNGDGTFSKASTLCLLDYFGATPRALALTGDLNRDGKADLVLASFSFLTDHIAVYYGNGDGTFAPPHEVYPFTGGAAAALAASEPYSPYQVKGLSLGDFYSDGQVNIAVSLLNTGPPMPGPNNQVFLLPEFDFLLNTFTGCCAGPLISGDFNGDGVLDLADGSGLLKMFLNAGNGKFTQLPDLPFGDGAGPIVSGDFNGDGILDLATVDGNTISVLLGNGDGTFTAKAGQPVSAQTNVSLITADINGDGRLDLVVADSAKTVSVWLGNGDGTFQAPVDTTGRGDSVVAADFNGDGLMDLAVTDSATGKVSILPQGSPYKAFVEPPIDADGTSVFSLERRAIPVRFTLTEYGVPTCNLPPARIAVTRTAGGTLGSINTGSYFGIDRSACQYVHYLATRFLGVGKYRVDISIDGTVVGDAVFTLQSEQK